MLEENEPNYIISTKVGNYTKYVLNAPFNNGKRKPALINELEKAKRFWQQNEAYNYITMFADCKPGKYEIEEYKPASQKN